MAEICKKENFTLNIKKYYINIYFIINRDNE